MRAALLSIVFSLALAGVARAQAPVRVEIHSSSTLALALSASGVPRAPRVTCLPPCEVSLAPGFYDLGLAPRWAGDQGPDPVRGIDLRAQAVIDVRVDEHRDLRTAGLVTLVASAFLFVAYVFALFEFLDHPSETGVEYLAEGAAVGSLLAIPVGIGLIAAGDGLRTSTTRVVTR